MAKSRLGGSVRVLMDRSKDAIELAVRLGITLELVNKLLSYLSIYYYVIITIALKVVVLQACEVEKVAKVADSLVWPTRL